MSIIKTAIRRLLLIVLTSLLIFYSHAAAGKNVIENHRAGYDIQDMISSGFPEDLQ
jgi:hypothetical protein